MKLTKFDCFAIAFIVVALCLVALSSWLLNNKHLHPSQLICQPVKAPIPKPHKVIILYSMHCLATLFTFWGLTDGCLPYSSQREKLMDVY